MQYLCTLDLLSHRISDAVPDPILQYNQGRWRQYLGWLRALGAVNGEAGDVDFSIRVVRIAFAVRPSNVGPVPEIWNRVRTIPASRRSRISRSRSASMSGAI